jgi:hypothetical protein
MSHKTHKEFLIGQRVQVLDDVLNYEGINLRYEHGIVIQTYDEIKFRNDHAYKVKFDNKRLKPIMLYSRNLRKLPGWRVNYAV